jgi:hypothetical protein
MFRNLFLNVGSSNRSSQRSQSTPVVHPKILSKFFKDQQKTQNQPHSVNADNLGTYSNESDKEITPISVIAGNIMSSAVRNANNKGAMVSKGLCVILDFIRNKNVFDQDSNGKGNTIDASIVLSMIDALAKSISKNYLVKPKYTYVLLQGLLEKLDENQGKKLFLAFISSQMPASFSPSLDSNQLSEEYNAFIQLPLETDYSFPFPCNKYIFPTTPPFTHFLILKLEEDQLIANKNKTAKFNKGREILLEKFNSLLVNGLRKIQMLDLW